MLSSIRTTPYGRRIQGKINAFDGLSESSSGQRTPAETPTPGSVTPGQSHPQVPTMTSSASNVLNPLAGAFGPVKTHQNGGEQSPGMASVTGGVTTYGTDSTNSALTGMGSPGRRPVPQEGRIQQPPIHPPFVPNLNRPRNDNLGKGPVGANGTNGSFF